MYFLPVVKSDNVKIPRFIDIIFFLYISHVLIGYYKILFFMSFTWNIPLGELSLLK